ncbi:hypothetical protein, partial [Aeromonas salmonicida]|uniref:hypothetical protein n=1 Tax=Aeromonas salmonicida TaxID=645 RepID=UPI0031D70ED7
QKAPSVTVTWGWGNHDLLADLGNNALIWATTPSHRIKFSYKKRPPSFDGGRFVIPAIGPNQPNI